MIPERISNDIPPLMKILNMEFCLKFECFKPQKASLNPKICDVINDVKQFPGILSQIFDVIQSDVA